MGNIAEREWQIGIQTGFGSAGAATRRFYATGTLTREAPPIKIDVDSGTYSENFIEPGDGVIKAGGSLSMALFMSQMIEFLRIALDGSVTGGSAQGSGAYLWTFTLGDTLSYATIEYNDGGDEWELDDAQATSLDISGSIAGDIKVAVGLIGSDKVQAELTSALEHFSPHATMGWEAKLYIDEIGDTPGTTNVSETLISYKVGIKNGMASKHLGDNTRAVGLISRGKMLATLDIVCEVNASALTEYTNWAAGTARLVRLELGNNKVISTGPKKEYMTIDIPCKLFTAVMGEGDGTATVNFTGEGFYDATNAFDIQIRVQNDRAS